MAAAAYWGSAVSVMVGFALFLKVDGRGLEDRKGTTLIKEVKGLYTEVRNNDLHVPLLRWAGVIKHQQPPLNRFSRTFLCLCKDNVETIGLGLHLPPPYCKWCFFGYDCLFFNKMFHLLYVTYCWYGLRNKYHQYFGLGLLKDKFSKIY